MNVPSKELFQYQTDFIVWNVMSDLAYIQNFYNLLASYGLIYLIVCDIDSNRELILCNV